MCDKSDIWQSGRDPFSLVYGGRPIAELLDVWSVQEDANDGDDAQRTCVRSYVDPSTGLRIAAHVKTLTHFPVTEWVLTIANEGTEDTPLLQDILPLDYTWEHDPTSKYYLHHAKGSDCRMDDFLPITEEIWTRCGMS